MLGKNKIILAVLALIIFLSAYLRFTGTKPGFQPHHSDEANIHGTVSDMIKNKNIKLQRYEYPSVSHLINLGFYKFVFIPTGWVKYYFANLGKIVDGKIQIPLGKDEYNRVFQLEILGHQDINTLYWSRYVTALVSVGVVLFSYLVGKKLIDFKFGLIVAILVAVNYRQALNAHFGLPDTYNAFFLLLSFYTSLRLLEVQSIKNFLIAGLVTGLALGTKYQFFQFLPFIVVFMTTHTKNKFLKFLLIPLIALLVFILTNPYQIIEIEKVIDQLSYASKLYNTGIKSLDIYSYSYLFHIGIGKITSIACVLGAVLMAFKHRKSFLLISSVVVPFFFMFTFWTGGGFYTRNFVSITPFVLLYASYLIYMLIKSHKIFWIIATIVLGLSLFENLKNALVVVDQYTKPWNRDVISMWISKNIPTDKLIAAHSSVPVPDSYKEVNYDLVEDFSLDEFREKKADYAVANLDWVNIDYYGWMRQRPSVAIKYWNKPTLELKETYAYYSFLELTNFSVFSVLNSWQAPDSDFIVFKVPYYKSKSLSNPIMIDTKDTRNGWSSEPIEVSDWGGFAVNYEIMTQSSDNRPDGYFVLKFFKSKEDVYKTAGFFDTRVSARNKIFNVWTKKTLVGTIPEGAKYVVIHLNSYHELKANASLRNLSIIKSEVEIDLEGVKVEKIMIDDNNIFPNSHGNL